MSIAIAERPHTYEEERGKPMPGFNHAVPFITDPGTCLIADISAVFS